LPFSLCPLSAGTVSSQRHRAVSWTQTKTTIGDSSQASTQKDDEVFEWNQLCGCSVCVVLPSVSVSKGFTMLEFFPRQT
jgi:hypothetical protein